jgi:3'-phosphoadenosine 5'-phosphosulfate sulfotransferase (PAPS reductase)/FAD synthetase
MSQPKTQNLFEDDTEERVEKMIQSAKDIVSAAIEEYNPVAIFGGFSGGNDSVVATHLACSEFGGAAIHCNTMIGVEKSRIHARETAAKFGWHLLEKQALPEGPPEKHRNGKPFDPAVLPTGRWNDGATAYEEWCFNFGMPGLGKRMHARMYQRLKERSFAAFMREAKAGKNRRSTVMFITGIRHDESAIRAGYQRAVQKQGSAVWVNPFYWQTKSDFELYRQEFGLPRNPVTACIGISGECLCGTMGDPSELELVRKIDPKIAGYIESVEQKCESLGLPCQWATAPVKKQKHSDLARSLFGDEPEFQPACGGCVRRRSEA